MKTASPPAPPPAPQAAVEPDAPPSDDSYRTFAFLAIASGAVMAVGSMLPWITATAPLVGTVNVSGTDGDGVITLTLGVVIALVGVVIVAQKGSQMAAIIGAVMEVTAPAMT